MYTLTIINDGIKSEIHNLSHNQYKQLYDVWMEWLKNFSYVFDSKTGTYKFNNHTFIMYGNGRK